MGGGRGKLVEKPRHFTQCNAIYRGYYDRVADIIASKNPDLAATSFLEIGCNTGINLLNLAARGANDCAGIDWTNYTEVFGYFGRTIGRDIRFQTATYDNLLHSASVDVPEVDVMINTVFMNHQSDPLQFLSFIADRARKGLFLWVLIETETKLPAITFRSVAGIHDLGAGKPFPLSLHNDIRISRPLLDRALHALGFGDITAYPHPKRWIRRGIAGLEAFTMVYASRTSETRSAYWPHA